jgi:hypothetical protein
MANAPLALDHEWSKLEAPTPPDELNGVRAPGLPAERPVYIAIDREGRRNLLVGAEPDAELPAQATGRGLHLDLQELEVADRPASTYIRLACVDAGLNQTFTAVAEDIVTAIRDFRGTSVEAVNEALRRWKWFWGIDPAELARDAALGLFGELWFMFRWMAPLSGAVIDRWHGADPARHDFQWPSASVEVKTSAARSAAGVSHRISSLDQLENPVTGDLYLFSLTVADDALAGNTLAGLVAQCRETLSETVGARTALDERLAAWRYNPANADRYGRTLRIISEEMFRVDDRFPRLTRTGLGAQVPIGVEDLTYALAMDACGPWRIASSPDDPDVAFLHDQI